jgi:hypothetical protein
MARYRLFVKSVQVSLNIQSLHFPTLSELVCQSYTMQRYNSGFVLVFELGCDTTSLLRNLPYLSLGLV